MGTVVISVDAELGWGFHDQPSLPRRRVEAARGGWLALLNALEAHGLPATWAVVGHLCLDRCDGHHADHPVGPSWFARERSDWAGRPDLRFGPDLVRAVRDADAGHELASHTFSHVQFGAPNIAKEVARYELDAWQEALDRLGVGSASSFVFPRNDVGHRDVLAERGYDCYRGVCPTSGEGAARRIYRKTLGATYGDATPPVLRPRVDEYGLVNVPASLFLFDLTGPVSRAFATVAEDSVVARARRGIDAAVERDGVFHMWLHPNNVTDLASLDRICSILSHLETRRAETDLRVETMRDVARRWEPRLL